MWKNIPGWKTLYEVSSKGEVRSLDRVSNGRRYRGRVLRPGISKNKYPIVVLSRPGKQSCVYVHDLVLLAFKGRKPAGKETCHNNGRRKDNRLLNLRYGTRSENALDRHKHGTFDVVPKGADNYNAKFTRKQVSWIRSQWCVPHRVLARKFGVCHGRIAEILRGDSYKT